MKFSKILFFPGLFLILLIFIFLLPHSALAYKGTFTAISFNTYPNNSNTSASYNSISPSFTNCDDFSIFHANSGLPEAQYSAGNSGFSCTSSSFSVNG